MELVQTTGEIIANLADESTLDAVNEIVGKAGGLVAKEGGRLVVGGLIKRGAERLFNEYKKRQQSGEIPEDFENTDHGAKLLQEALNALAAR